MIYKSKTDRAAELSRLIDAAISVSESRGKTPELVILGDGK
jgi:hypothetical protein